MSVVLEKCWRGNPQFSVVCVTVVSAGGGGFSCDDSDELVESMIAAISKPRHQSEDRRSSRSADLALLNDCCRHRARHLSVTSEQAAKELSLPASWRITASISSCDLSSIAEHDMVGVPVGKLGEGEMRVMILVVASRGIYVHGSHCFLHCVAKSEPRALTQNVQGGTEKR